MLVELLQPLGWVVLNEVTFAVFGERGSIDILAWHPPTRTLLVVEVKTEIASAEEMLRRHDVKVRLAPRICRERFGVNPLSVARLLVVEDSTTNRARTVRLGALLGAYPLRGRELRKWLANPTGQVGGLLFLNTARGGGRRLRRDRVRTAPRRGTAPGGESTPART